MKPFAAEPLVERHHVIAAVDESPAGDQAVKTAVEIAGRVSGKVTVLHVVSAPARRGVARAVDGGWLAEDEVGSPEERVRRRLEPNIPGGPSPSVDVKVVYGFPAIEISRFADESQADLVVLGRKQHAERSRLLLGDTADAVVRRNRVPTLLVPPSGTRLSRILVAVDGTKRGMTVLDQACAFARRWKAGLHVVTVESASPQEAPIVSPRLSRTDGVEARVKYSAAQESLPSVGTSVRRGDIATEVLKELQAGGHDLLIIGHHRGGPAWLVQNSSTAQQLGHAAPCAVLTIPL